MKTPGLFATVMLVATLTFPACVTEVESPVGTDEEPPATDVLAAELPDSFACYRPESASTLNRGYRCDGSPNLSLSTLCREGTTGSYHVIHVPTAPDMTMGVIAPHGGKIEPDTDEIALAVAGELGLPRYALIAHATDSCLDRYGGSTRSNHRALHITSTHFNDSRAEVLMRSVHRGLSVHGHGGPNKICVGGATPALRDAFRTYYTTYAAKYSPSGARAVDAPDDDDCDHIAGTNAHNISNRSRSGAGLQLELSRTVRSELVASLAGDRRLWTSFRNAIRSACRTSIGGVRGCL